MLTGGTVIDEEIVGTDQINTLTGVANQRDKQAQEFYFDFAGQPEARLSYPDAPTPRDANLDVVFVDQSVNSYQSLIDGMVPSN